MRTRVFTSLALVPIALAAFSATSTWPLVALATITFMIGSAELTRLFTRKPNAFTAPSPAFMAACGAVVLAWGATTKEVAFAVLWPAFLAGSRGALWIAQGTRARIVRYSATLWIAAPLLFGIALHRSGVPTQPAGPFSWNPALLLALPVWAGDTAGIVIGGRYGRKLLAPRITPKKTQVGAIANLLAAIAVGAALGPLCGVPVWKGAVCGVAAGVFGQIGDLLESGMKRAAGVKNSGELLPGHGGLLDRVDSLLFAAPFVSSILVLL